MYHQFYIQKLQALPTLYLFVLNLSDNTRDLCQFQLKLVGIYNIDFTLYNPVDSIFTTNFTFNNYMLGPLSYSSENNQRLVQIAT